jgi:hypothetical protein
MIESGGTGQSRSSVLKVAATTFAMLTSHGLAAPPRRTTASVIWRFDGTFQNMYRNTRLESRAIVRDISTAGVGMAFERSLILVALRWYH